MAETQEPQAPIAQTDEAGQESKEIGVRATVAREGACNCTIRVEADADKLQARYQETLAALHTQTAMPGFRQGKAPLSLVAKRFAGRIKSDVLSAALSEGYQKAVAEGGLTVVAETDAPDPETMEWEPGRPAEFTIKCEVLPEIELNEEQYKGLTVQVPRLDITDELLEQEMKAFAGQLGRWQKAEDGHVEAGDYVKAQVSLAADGDKAAWSGEVDFFVQGVQMGPFTAEKLAETMVGKKAGESVELIAKVREEAVREADEALKQRAGQDLPVRVKVIEAFRRHTPEMDDELAKKLGLENAGKIREIVRERLQTRLANQKREASEFAVISAVLETVNLEMPPSLVQRAALEEQRRLILQAIRRGTPIERAEKMAAETAHLSQHVALHRLKTSYVLRKIADKEGIYVLEDEVKEEIRTLAAREGWPEAKTRRYVEQHDLESMIRNEKRQAKTAVFLLKSAALEEIDSEEFERRRREKLAPAGGPSAEAGSQAAGQ
jgi:trigger factor